MHSEGSPVVPQDDELAYQYFKKAADKVRYKKIFHWLNTTLFV
jgi:TPR repeat protein